MRRLAYEEGKASCGPGGRTDVDPVFVDERGFVHQLIAIGGEVVKAPWSAHAGYCGGVVGDTPEDM